MAGPSRSGHADPPEPRTAGTGTAGRRATRSDPVPGQDAREDSAGGPGGPRSPAGRRAWAALAWTAGAAAVFAITEVFLGLHTLTMHVAMALVYLIITACAVAIAVTGAHGASRAARAAVVVAVLAAPALIGADRWIVLGIPDHTGTTVFLLACCLLIDKAPGRRFTAPLLGVILCAGQIGDATVRYVTVPAIALVCAYQVLASREIRGGDAANFAAAVVSLPTAIAVRAGMRHLGSYLMVTPKTQLAPVSRWAPTS